jgi:inward rectifier potassium channel
MAKRQKFQPNLSYTFEVVGARRAEISDAYHAFLRMRWWQAIGFIVLAYLVLNTAFALVYLAVGGLENARAGSFADAFFFSVQTFGTIGYGMVHPASMVANIVVVVESITGLITTALATGLIFVRFSLTRARMMFSRHATIGPMDGVPTLMIRIGNDRSSQIFDAQMRVSISMTMQTKEGSTFYLSFELPLVRDRAAALARSWNLLHKIDAASPLAGHTAHSLGEAEAEIHVAVSGVDETSMQAVHARHIYEASSIVWNARLADVLSGTPDGNIVLDLRRFHDVVPVEAAPAQS